MKFPYIVPFLSYSFSFISLLIPSLYFLFFIFFYFLYPHALSHSYSLLYFLALIPAFIISDFHVSIITLKYLLYPSVFFFIIYLRNFLLSRSFNIARCILPLFIVICLPQFIDYISGAFLCKPLILSSISDESSYLLKRRLVCTLSYRTGDFWCQ